MDVTNEESIKKCQKFLGGKKIFISILINNASVNPTNNKLKSLFLEKYNLGDWEKEIKVGLTGAFICTKIFGSQFAKNKNGSIINVSSDLGVKCPKQSLYSHLNYIKPILNQ